MAIETKEGLSQEYQEYYEVVIIGAGAAGLMCGIAAGNRGRKVLIMDHANRVGKKILISGGGRCNFTNSGASPDNYQSQNPSFCISALKTYTPDDFIYLVDSHKIPYYEKKLGQLFCQGTSREIVNMLVTECDRAGVTIALNCHVQEIQLLNAFHITVDDKLIQSDSLVMATGGASIPQMGSTRFTYQIARQFGLPLTEIRPGLVPLTFSGPRLEFCRSLAGLSIPTVVSSDRFQFEENLLFTHKGISGPAILQISSHWREQNPIIIDLLPRLDLLSYLKDARSSHPRSALATILSSQLPRNFVRAISGTYFPNKPMNTLSDNDIDNVTTKLKEWELYPSGTEGYRTAEVSLGGVDTSKLSSRTMEANDISGLYFIGEAVDVTGPLGGYNFQWAWASGFAAGQQV